MASGDFVSYIRVSTRSQGESRLGLEAQQRAINVYLNGGDWRIIQEFVEVESGRKSDRPVLAQALAHASLYRIPLIVAKVDRLTRSAAFLQTILESGVDVRFCDLPKIEGAVGRFLLQQMASVAELEAGMISARTKAALQSVKERGQTLGGFRGYTPSSDDRAEGRKVNTDRANTYAQRIAETITSIRAEGITTLRDIAQALNEKGLPTQRGGKWQPTQVQRVLARISAATAA